MIPKGKLRDLRSLAILKRKLTSGMSHELIGNEFGVSVDTVRRSLRSAMNDQLVQRFEDEMLKDLVPEAMATARQAMKEGNATVALEILKGMGVLKKQRDVTHNPDAQESDSLEVYIKAKRARRDDRSSRANLTPSHPATLPHSGPEPFTPISDPDDETTVFQADGFSSLSGVPGPTYQDGLAYREGELAGDEEDGA